MDDDSQESKPRLSDVLGALVSSVAYARNVADVEALRIAHRYRQNELLRGLPVPRLRFSRIAVSLPVIITEVIPAVAAEPAAPSVVAAAAAKTLMKTMADIATEHARAEKSPYTSGEMQQLEDETAVAEHGARWHLLMGVYLDYDSFKGFQQELEDELEDQLLDLAQASGTTPLSDTAILETVRDTINRLLKRFIRRALMRAEQMQATADQPFDQAAAKQRALETLASEPVEDLLQVVRDAAQHVAIVRPTEPADFYVEVDTDIIKNAGGGPATVTQLQLVLHEEGLEWLGEIQRDGTQIWKLSQE